MSPRMPTYGVRDSEQVLLDRNVELRDVWQYAAQIPDQDSALVRRESPSHEIFAREGNACYSRMQRPARRREIELAVPAQLDMPHQSSCPQDIERSTDGGLVERRVLGHNFSDDSR